MSKAQKELFLKERLQQLEEEQNLVFAEMEELEKLEDDLEIQGKSSEQKKQKMPFSIKQKKADSQSRIGNVTPSKVQIFSLELKTRTIKNRPDYKIKAKPHKNFFFPIDIEDWEKENEEIELIEPELEKYGEIAETEEQNGDSLLDEASLYLGSNPLQDQQVRTIREDLASRIKIWIKETSKKKDEKEELLSLTPEIDQLKLKAPALNDEISRSPSESGFSRRLL